MLLSVPHVRQRRQADCLVACAAMVLDYLLVNDPDFAAAPLIVDHTAFLAAWQERDYRYIVIGLASVE